MFARGAAEHGGADGYAAYVRDARLAARDERARLPDRRWRSSSAAVLAIAADRVGLVAGAASRRVAGAAAYYALYNGLFFVVHGYLWSLSAFNSETQVTAFMNGRMVEAAAVGARGRRVSPRSSTRICARSGPGTAGSARTCGGWLTLAPATLLVVLGTLALQVAWFLWWWGAIGHLGPARLQVGVQVRPRPRADDRRRGRCGAVLPWSRI